MKKNLDYYYKAACMDAKDEIEKKRFEVINEYGYNFESTEERIIDQDKLISKVQHNVNKEYLNSKR